MDPCPFVRLIIESLALKLPQATKRAGSGVYPLTTPCYCTIKLKNFPTQSALLPICTAAVTNTSPPESTAASVEFHLDSAALRRLSGNQVTLPVKDGARGGQAAAAATTSSYFRRHDKGKIVTLRVSVYSGRMGRTCGITRGKLLGRVHVSVGLEGGELRAAVFQNGWVKLGREPESPAARFHLTVRTEPDPRFVFQFGGEPECSPVVFQIQGNIRQPVFSCKFSANRNERSRSHPSDYSTNNTRGWLRTFSGEREKPGRERKGWMITIHDLSGSPVAAASMITPFVPSPGSDRVSRSNPGAWLILRPHGFSFSSWKPWGRLEAWRERGPVDGLGYKFELVTDAGTGLTSGIPIAEGTMSVKKGGQFCIDSRLKDSALSSLSLVRGFVMNSTVEGEGKVSKPTVQVGVQHVTCMPDAALFVALSAAVDLSMDSCRLFSRKLRKEFWHDEQEFL